LETLLRRFYVSLMLLLISGLICFSCVTNEEESDDSVKVLPELDFSFSDTFKTTFSIKTSKSDTIFLKQHFSGEGTELKPGTYYTRISPQDRDTLKQYFADLRFDQLDTLYDEGYEDGSTFKVCKSGHGVERCVRVHSHSAPPELQRLARFIVKAKQNWTCVPLDSNVHFVSEKGVDVSEPNVESVKFLPPE
jgi:hypothetical protein